MTRVRDEPGEGIRGWVKRRPVASFCVLAYSISWLPAMSGYRREHGQVLMMIAQFGPALAALFLTCYTGAPIHCWAGRVLCWRVGLW